MKWDENWAEVFSLLLIVAGFLLAVVLRNPLVSYLSIFVAGFLAGRTYYLKKMKEPIFPFILIILGFLLGYLVGGIWVSRVAILIFFGLGFAISYYLHLKKILVSFKSENYVK